MILTSVQTLEVLLAATTASSQLPVVASWADMLDDASTLAPNTTVAQVAGVAPVAAVAPPATGQKRQLKFLSVFNADTVLATVTVRVDTSGAKSVLVEVPLPPKSRLEFTFGSGFRVFTSDGAVRGVGTPGDPGPAGPPGPPGVANLEVIHPAGGPLSSSRAAALDLLDRAVYPDRLDPATAPRVIGVLATSASAVNDPVTVRRRGTISELAWAWDVGPVWIGDTGLLTQIAPESGWLLQIGVALDSTTVDIDPQPPIYL